jgi:membrane protease subunit HflC
VEEVQQKVYERMVAERQRIADRFRSEGEGEAQRIRGERERDLKQIESEAYRQAQSVVGRADSLSTRIYARAYNRTGDTRAFYDFMKTMETYRTTLDAETWPILSTDGDLYRRLVAPRA